ncbi:transmembrane and ubiquitin-like domain-containing protein 2 [Gambusia affinis]|uniref:transmembrane and ubiquitin-like domain-containing protein 2 n=1 Tax=Gambusia affinis TaxID=33528 RepID=UPI001CDBFEDE|nr:transmembrane and ubiquitin-like domain-containing protein 2 [Gambusia affinis]
MAVCALTMLEGVEEEVVATGGALLLALALILAWLSTHVADRGDHILGTILTVGAHASLIGLGAHENYSGGPNVTDAPEQQAAQPAQEIKPDDGEPANERGEGDAEAAEDVWTDLRLDIRSKQPQVGALHFSDGEEDEADENDDEEEELKEVDRHPVKALLSLRTTIPCASTTTSISVRLKFLNDTEEVAVVEPEDTVGILKSKCFSGREHQVKLIYQGQLLQDPKKTLFSLNITDNSVIHCHISQAVQGPNPEEGSQPGTGAGPVASGGFRSPSVAISTSSMVVPVFVVILAVVWYFRINYRQFFTAPATISLVGVTVFFSFLIFGMHSR